MKYGTTGLKVAAVVKFQTDTNAATPSPTTFQKCTQTLEIVCEQAEMLPVTSSLGSIQTRLGLETPQAHTGIASVLAYVVPNPSLMEVAKPVEFISFDQWI
jgi:hypothetical protein